MGWPAWWGEGGPADPNERLHSACWCSSRDNAAFCRSETRATTYVPICTAPPPKQRNMHHVSRLTMPARVQSVAEAMCGTMTAFLHSARPAFISGSSSNTSKPAGEMGNVGQRGHEQEE